MKNKGFAPIIILVLIALAVAGYFGYKNYQEKNKPRLFNDVLPRPTATSDPTANWKTYSFSKIGFSFKLPSDWSLLSSREISTASVELEVLNNSDPMGQYYMEKVISGPEFFIGPKTLLEKYQLPRDSQKLAMLTSVINGNFVYGGTFLKSTSSLRIDNKEVTVASSDTMKEAFFPLSNKEVGNFGLSLLVENSDNFKLFDQIHSTFEFLEPNTLPSATPISNY